MSITAISTTRRTTRISP